MQRRPQPRFHQALYWLGFPYEYGKRFDADRASISRKWRGSITTTALAMLHYMTVTWSLRAATSAASSTLSFSGLSKDFMKTCTTSFSLSSSFGACSSGSVSRTAPSSATAGNKKYLYNTRHWMKTIRKNMKQEQERIWVCFLERRKVISTGWKISFSQMTIMQSGLQNTFFTSLEMNGKWTTFFPEIRLWVRCSITNTIKWN